MRDKKETLSKISEEKNRLFKEGDAAWDDGDLQQAFTLFMRAAKLGDASSQLDLGYFFDNGLFVKKDKKQALKWYHRAYLQGDAGGANNIGTIYRDLGDTTKMLWWFRRAAAMGDIDVLFNLGERYEFGSSVPKNLAKAKMFYRRACSCRNSTADDKAKAKKRLTRLAKAKKTKTAGNQ